MTLADHRSLPGIAADNILIVLPLYSMSMVHLRHLGRVLSLLECGRNKRISTVQKDFVLHPEFWLRAGSLGTRIETPCVIRKTGITLGEVGVIPKTYVLNHNSRGRVFTNKRRCVVTKVVVDREAIARLETDAWYKVWDFAVSLAVGATSLRSATNFVEKNEPRAAAAANRRGFSTGQLVSTQISRNVSRMNARNGRLGLN
jgi:hypothetical protein